MSASDHITLHDDGSRTVRGIVSLAKGEPVEQVEITVPAPGPNDVVVRVDACGVCHTDLAYRDGDIEDAYPFLLGHEAAGVVIDVGEDVTHVAEGDFVVLNWRAVCGECRACRKGEPKYCFNTHNASKKMTLADGTELSPALGIGAFCDATLVHEGQCTKVNPDADPAVAGLLGCGVMAGLGAAINTGEVTRGESVAVIGCGGVGTASIAGAKLAGATTIIAVDVSDAKLETARSFGATHVINSRELADGRTGEDDPVVARIRELTGGFGADVVIDAVGVPETYVQAFYARDLAGRVVLVGVPSPTMTLDLPLLDVFGRGGSLKSSWYGDCLPERDFPMLVDLSLEDRLPLKDFVTERIGLGDVEAAFDTMKAGAVLRSVVVN
ncbi:S-(hydroxymethyl)mycothiol dehydrogenase [Corynebacterium sp. 335C]